MRKLGLLTFCDSPNQAEELASLTRTLGYAIDQTSVDNSSEFLDALGSPDVQLALVTINRQRTALPTPAPTVRMAPVIALVEETDAAEFGDLLAGGADDVAFLFDPAHVKHCIRRVLNRRQTEQSLVRADVAREEALQQLMILLQSITQPVAFIHEGMHVYANPAYLQLLGFNSLEDLQATPILDLVADPQNRTELSEAFRLIEAHLDTDRQLTVSFVTTDEDEICYQTRLTPSRFDGEIVTQLVLTQSIEMMEEAPLTTPQPPGLQISDPTTHLYNQHHMLNLLEDTVTYAREHSTEYLLYLIHLETGPEDEKYRDQCMREAAARLQDVIDENDVLGRNSGNTFLLLSLYNKTHRPETQAEKLRRAIGDLDGLLPGVTRCRVSGVIIDKYCKNGEHAIARLNDTFIQAQEADEPVKIDVAQFIHMPGSQTMDHVWARRVSTILKNNRLTLSSLPIYSLRHDAWERFSLHLNLIDDAGESVPLSQFQDTVIQTGLASNVDRWIIFNAARQLVEKLRDTPGTQFFIPLVGNVMLEDDLYPWIEKIIDQFKLPANSIVLQTSVDSALKYPDAFAVFCRKMKTTHCGVYLTGLDDPTITHELFGDSKNHIDYLAVDKGLLDGLENDPEKHETIEILVQQCHRQNTLTVVADPVEPEVLSELWKLGVDLMINSRFSDKADELMELDLTATLSA